MPRRTKRTRPIDALVPAHVTNTVESLGRIHARAEASVTRHQRGIERITRVLGSPRGLYVIIVFVGAWASSNGALILSGHRPFDAPPFFILQGLVSLAALLATTMVLATQNRVTGHSDERSRLDLEVNLLSEAKVTKLIALLEELRRDLPNVPNRADPVADAMQEAVDPHEVLSAIAQSLDDSTAKNGGS
jgi:uncharacterized membrane protein